MVNHLARHVRLYAALVGLAMLGWYLQGWIRSRPFAGEGTPRQSSSAAPVQTSESGRNASDPREHDKALAGPKAVTAEADYAIGQVAKQDSFARAATQDALNRRTSSSAASGMTDARSRSKR